MPISRVVDKRISALKHKNKLPNNKCKKHSLTTKISNKRYANGSASYHHYNSYNTSKLHQMMHNLIKPSIKTNIICNYSFKKHCNKTNLSNSNYQPKSRPLIIFRLNLLKLILKSYRSIKGFMNFNICKASTNNKSNHYMINCISSLYSYNSHIKKIVNSRQAWMMPCNILLSSKTQIIQIVLNSLTK